MENFIIRKKKKKKRVSLWIFLFWSANKAHESIKFLFSLTLSISFDYDDTNNLLFDFSKGFKKKIRDDLNYAFNWSQKLFINIFIILWCSLVHIGFGVWV